MQTDDKKNENENPLANYNPMNRDFQRTEEDIDNVSKSEKEAANKNTEEANTTPGKDKV